MYSGFKVDGFLIPNFYDTNNDKKLSANEISLFCDDNKLKYDDKTQKITAATGNNSEVELKLDSEKYSIENLKQRYPEDKYLI